MHSRYISLLTLLVVAAFAMHGRAISAEEAPQAKGDTTSGLDSGVYYPEQMFTDHGEL